MNKIDRLLLTKNSVALDMITKTIDKHIETSAQGMQLPEMTIKINGALLSSIMLALTTMDSLLNLVSAEPGQIDDELMQSFYDTIDNKSAEMNLCALENIGGAVAEAMPDAFLATCEEMGGDENIRAKASELLNKMRNH